MKKLTAIFTVCILLFSSLFSTTLVQANQKPATILINGSELITDVSPVEKGNRTLVPFRAIFEALDAKVTWNQSTKTVGATKGDTTISLRLGSLTATINNQTVQLDVSAHTINNRTMVPIRFVSEALGADVRWEQSTRTVHITTSTEVRPAYNVNAKDIADYGDGRDLEISFTKSPDEATVAHYRILLVKTKDVRHFDLKKASDVNSRNYTVVNKNGKDQSVKLSSSTRDVDGDLIRNNESYTVFVLTVGNALGKNMNVLSVASPAIILTTGTSDGFINNLRVADVNNFNDGRDLEVSFTRPANDTNVSNYRIFVVKTKDANKFDLAAANKVASRDYTVVSKSGSAGSTLTTTLSSTARDTSGDYIKNGVSYTVFVLAVASNSNSSQNRLSSPSATITLSNNVTSFAPTNVRVADISNYGDGRDLEVRFTKSNDETRVSYYRIFVVRSADVNNFDLAAANNVSSANSFDVSKTNSGTDIVTTLNYNSRDTRGNTIRNGETYRVFVMSVGNDRAGYQNALSSYSTTITLSNNTVIYPPTNVTVADVSDNNDGRDLQVSFTRSSDEYKVDHYRVFVVRSTDVNNFTLDRANRSSDYYYLSKSGSGNTLTTTLSSTTKDTSGNFIRNGIQYRVFVMAVGNESAGYTNALSSYSSLITLDSNQRVPVATNLSLAKINENGNASSLELSFTRASDEARISEYRIFLVKNGKSFDVTTATNLNSRYIKVDKNGGNRTISLSGAVDTDGAAITTGVSYRAFVLSVSSTNSSTTNALSGASNSITLEKQNAPAVSNVSVNDVSCSAADNCMIQIGFDKPDQANIANYKIFVVRADDNSFNREAANDSEYYNSIGTGNLLPTTINVRLDYKGNALGANQSYRVYVLSVSKSNDLTTNTLSTSYASFVTTYQAPNPDPTPDPTPDSNDQ